MGDYLDAKVTKVGNAGHRKRLILHFPSLDPELSLFQRNVEFYLPRPVDVQEGDTITFYHGSVGTTDTHLPGWIRHDSGYVSGVVYRGEEPVFEFDAKHMRLGLPIYRHLTRDQTTTAPFLNEAATTA